MAHHPPKKFTPLVPTTRSTDTRSEDEIVQHILSHRPVVHEKNVWTFWDKGWDAIQPWTKRNIVDWVRRLGPDSEWQVHVLDVVPDSPCHVRRFVDEALLPPAFSKFDYERMDCWHTQDHRGEDARARCAGGAWVIDVARESIAFGAG